MRKKIMTLNAWGGKKARALCDFIQDKCHTDIICLQEVFSRDQQPVPYYESDDCMDLYEKIGDILPNHRGVFCPIVPQSYGLAVFLKDDIALRRHGHHWVYHNSEYQGQGPFHSRCLQWIECEFQEHVFVVFNIHGLVNGKGKTDSPERFEQLENTLAFAKKFTYPVIFVGDFNVTLQTEYIRRLSGNWCNLIKKHGVESTRSSFYSKQDRYADYIFLPSCYQDLTFEVVDLSISDHLPLSCEFKLIEHSSYE